jgi:predicted dehydrogenase
MALTLKDAKDMNYASLQNSVFLMVNFTNRFMDGPRKVKELLDEGVIGEPYSIRIRYVHAGPYNNWAKSDWFYNVGQAGGGALMDMGIHAIDMCHFLMGPIKTISAALSNLSKDIPVEDNAVAMVEFDRHRVGIIEVGWTGAGGFTGIEVCGSQGSIVLDLRKGLFVTENKSYPDGSVDFNEDKVPCEISHGGWETAIVDFISCLENNTPPSCDGDLGYEALKVLLAAYKSAEDGQKIVL